MSEKQIWQVKGLETSRRAVETVLHTFSRDGVQGIESQQALVKYVKRLSDDSLRDMCAIDEETALQLLVDCYGVTVAFQKYVKAEGFIKQEKVDSLGWISPEAYREVVGKYEERAKKLEEQKDRILSDYTRAAEKAEDAETEIMRLRDELAHCKADLYDFYAKEGKLPDYERR